MKESSNKKRIFTKEEIEKNIEKLFVKLWPRMMGREIAKSACYNNLDDIVEKFNTHSTSFNKLLSSLSSMDGLGLVISTGLIFIAYPDSAVPFDKYTMGYSLKVNILYNPNISDNRYLDACSKVVEYIDNHPTINNILEFVRMAGNIDPILLTSPE